MKKIIIISVLISIVLTLVLSQIPREKGNYIFPENKTSYGDLIYGGCFGYKYQNYGYPLVSYAKYEGTCDPESGFKYNYLFLNLLIILVPVFSLSYLITKKK